jgi:hypothetical protein
MACRRGNVQLVWQPALVCSAVFQTIKKQYRLINFNINPAEPFYLASSKYTLIQKIIISFFLMFSASCSMAQDSLFKKNPAPTDTLTAIRRLNRYGYLLNDDPKYNPKYPVWKPVLRVMTTNLVNWSSSRYIYNFDWARISLKSWKYNLKEGFEWDNDLFATNFIGHPHTGNTYFNVARSEGYNYWQSFPFAVEGSLMWEYFGENERPSINDIINTPVGGAFLGEIIYRISSNILDDSKRGKERVIREIAAALIDPTRGLNRLTQGKMFRVTPSDVYQKEPINVTVTAGALSIDNIDNRPNRLNEKSVVNAVATFQLDYGDPFETLSRKPFDLFRLRAELSYGTDTRLLGNVNGYGILKGWNLKENRLLAGIFQHFDYINNSLFQIGALGFGGGLISKFSISPKSNIYSNIHLALVPLAGNNTYFGSDSSFYRAYNFGAGAEAKVEETLNLNKWASLGFTGFYYFIHTYQGLPGNSIVGVYNPNLTIQILRISVWAMSILFITIPGSLTAFLSLIFT